MSIRADAMLLADEAPPHEITVPVTLITRTMLDTLGVSTVEQLEKALPACGSSDAATASWMQAGG